MKKRTIAIMLAFTVAVSTLIGCGTSSKPAAEDTSTSKEATDSVAKAEVLEEDGSWSRAYAGTKLTFLDVSPSDRRTSYFNELFKEFYKDTGIEVEYQSVPWDDAANKITVLGAASKLPDVFTVWSGWLGQYTDAGWVLPLSDYLNDTKDEYTDAVVNIIWKSEQTRYNDIYTIPDGLMVKGIYVRKDWCEEQGIKLDPQAGWTYDEYFELVEKLTDSTKGRYGASYRGARGALDPLLTYMQGYTNGATYDQDGKILLNSEECLEAFTKWTDIYKKGYAPEDSINWGFTEMVDNFVGGLTGTLINDSEVAATLISQMDDSQWMVMPMPTSEKDGKIYNTINAPYSYSIAANTKNPEASWELLQYMSNSEKQAEYCQLTGEIPIKKDASNLDYYSNDGYYGVFLEQMNNEKLAVPASYGAFDYTDLHQGLFHEEIQSYLLGDIDAAGALSNICEALQERQTTFMEENPDSTIETALTMK